FLHGFLNLEKDNVRQNIVRVTAALDREFSNLETKGTDWSAWDDTCNFVAIPATRRNYIKSNLVDPTFDLLSIDFMLFQDTSGRTVFTATRKSNGKTGQLLAAAVQRYLAQHPELLKLHADQRVTGIIANSDMPIMVSIQPILSSTGTGPSYGTFCIGRRCDSQLTRRLRGTTRLDLAMKPVDGHLPADYRTALAAIRHTQPSSKNVPVYNHIIDSNTIAGYTDIRTIDGQPALMIKVLMDRAIYQEGLRSLRSYIIFLLAGGLGALCLIMALLDRLVISRLGRLSARVVEIGKGGDMSSRLSVEGHDELSDLSIAMNDMLAALQDSEKELLAREALRESEERYRTLVELSTDAVVIEQHGHCVYANAAAVAMVGVQDATDLRDRSVMSLLNPDTRQIAEKHWKMIEHGVELPHIEQQILRVDGGVIDVEVSAIPFEYQGQPAVQFIGRDISARKRSEQQLNYLAYHDALTGLPNRLLCMDRLSQALARAERFHEMVAVVLLDLDGFKLINDSLGHEHGDRLLKEVAARLHGLARLYDTVARLSGDEFVLVLPRITAQDTVKMVTSRILTVLAQPFMLDGQESFITASIGVAFFPQDGTDAETLIKYADLAMYRAKAQGKNNVVLYSPDMGSAIAERRRLEGQLRKAIQNQELVIHYQPQIDLRSGRCVGVEALVRWQHPQFGMIPPGKFIPIAEESGLITRVDDWVLWHACQQLREWLDSGLPPFRVAVNLSARHFLNRNLVNSIKEVLQETGLPPHNLEIEITENTAMNDLERSLAILHDIHDLGVQIAIDDFGTGYSSLGYLKRFPIHTLKIDRMFVKDILHDADAAAIVKAIVAMTHTMNRHVIVEGVEVSEQLALLNTFDCDEVQGYVYSKPLPVGELPQFIRNCDASCLADALTTLPG
ncbi:MAG TPA: EAL domain-containing protein, partial [Armatimonadota bacterium]|nr:EAL domain-containing protein [Armatimonadota bacterium]